MVQSSAKSRYNGVTAELRRTAGTPLQFQVNYTLSCDKSDDDNERDPFSFRYARADSLQAEYGYSDRDQRHRFNAWVLAILPGDFYLNNRLSAYSAQPASESCGANNQGTGTRVASNSPAPHLPRRPHPPAQHDPPRQRLLLVGHPAVAAVQLRPQGTFEAIFEVFNVTNADNFKDPSSGGTFLNFDGTIRSGLGEPRQFQVGGR